MSNQQSGNEKSKSKSQKLQTMELNGKNYMLLDKYFYNPDDVIGEGALANYIVEIIFKRKIRKMIKNVLQRKWNFQKIWHQ